MGSSTAPTICMRPLGLSVCNMAVQSSGTFTVTSEEIERAGNARDVGFVATRNHYDAPP